MRAAQASHVCASVVARAAAESFIALKSGARAAEIIERSLEQTWDSELAALYGACADADSDAGATVPRIERAERWLTAHPQDASLLLTLGQLCARQALWGKAQNYLDASIAIEATYPAHLAAARLHENLGNADNAQRHTRAALELASRAWVMESGEITLQGEAKALLVDERVRAAYLGE